MEGGGTGDVGIWSLAAVPPAEVQGAESPLGGLGPVGEKPPRS